VDPALTSPKKKEKNRPPRPGTKKKKKKAPRPKKKKKKGGKGSPTGWPSRSDARRAEPCTRRRRHLPPRLGALVALLIQLPVLTRVLEIGTSNGTEQRRSEKEERNEGYVKSIYVREMKAESR